MGIGDGELADAFQLLLRFFRHEVAKKRRLFLRFRAWFRDFRYVPVLEGESLRLSASATPRRGLRIALELLYIRTGLPRVGSDIFGRMMPTGVETMQYLGVKDRRAIFQRRTVETLKQARQR